MQQQRYIRIKRPQGNLFYQAIGLVLGLIALMGAVIIGGFLLAGLIGIALIAWLVIYIRLWWLTRKMGPRGAAERYVEAEYKVVDVTEKDQGDR
jgi:hypothetical protein